MVKQLRPALECKTFLVLDTQCRIGGNTIVTVTEDGKDLITHSSTHRASHTAKTDEHKNLDGNFATSESVTLSKLEQWQQENDTNENWGYASCFSVFNNDS